jgi:hypothetical protein
MPIKRGKVVRKQSANPNYTWCSRTANRTSLCFRLCQPTKGMGECGRVAGHAQLGRTQLAILAQRRRDRVKQPGQRAARSK